eukprot:1158402-Pelagomonas_calceolata.AAC.6
MLEVSKLVALGGLVAEPVCVASRCADSVRLGKQEAGAVHECRPFAHHTQKAPLAVVCHTCSQCT